MFIFCIIQNDTVVESVSASEQGPRSRVVLAKSVVKGSLANQVHVTLFVTERTVKRKRMVTKDLNIENSQLE